MNEYDYFGFHKLNFKGQEQAVKIQELFEALKKTLEPMFSEQRARSLALTKLEEACFFAKKSMALSQYNQEPKV